jgi:multicomponent Na+:H+ antiporter subunit A
MARMHPAMSGTDVWLWTLTIFGALTAVFASLLALRQTDLKQALAYTTLMALGTLTLFLGQESGYAMTAFATFLIVHSLYKASLFLVVGCIDLSTGTRETDQLGGLGRIMPITAVAAALAALSMAGFPPFLGFIGKELKYAGAIAVASEPLFVAGAALLSNALMLAVAGVVAFRPFWQGSVPSGQSPREAPWQMWAGPIILASLGAIFGIYPDLLQVALINPTVISLTGEVGEAKELKLWAGINIPLFLSIATFVLGLLFYWRHVQLRAMLERGFQLIPNLDNGWDSFLDGLKGFAKWQTQLVQNGKLSSYLFGTFLTIAAGILLTLLYTGMPMIAVDLSDVEWKHTSIALLTIAGALLALVTNSRIAGIAALGVVGIGIALIFIVFSAPDVAITQLLVETLIVVLVAVVMLRLPSMPKAEFRLNHAVLSIAVGVAVSLTLIAVVSSPLDLRLTEYFEVTSWPEAYGRNIVNVILVDFRALDTFGEIAVVVIAALSAYALLRTTRKGDQK